MRGRRARFESISTTSYHNPIPTNKPHPVACKSPHAVNAKAQEGGHGRAELGGKDDGQEEEPWPTTVRRHGGRHDVWRRVRAVCWGKEWWSV